VRVLKRLGYRIAIISGGFSRAADALKRRLGIDYAFSNNLEIEGASSPAGWWARS
jgi:phosphoserine phosphatase